MNRDVALDGARGFAVLLVTVYHSTLFREAESLLERALVAPIRVGWSSVDFFFVLSGFLITRILLREREAPHFFRAFYGRRFLRIIPLYYLLLFVLFVLVPVFELGAAASYFWAPGAAREQVWYWLFLANLSDAAAGQFQHNFLAVAWTLAIEEQFYFLWPFLVWKLEEKTLFRVCVGTIGFCLVARTVALVLGAHPLMIYIATPFQMDALAFGALIALIARQPKGLDGLGGLGTLGLPICFAAFGSLSAALIVHPQLLGAPKGLSLLAHPYMQSIGYTLSAAFHASLIIHFLVHPSSKLSRFFASRPLVLVGTYSYGIYLLHLPIRWLSMRYLYNPATTDWPFLAEQALGYAIVVGLSVASAWTTWHFIESPFQRLRHHFSYRDADQPRPHSAPR